MGPRAASLLAWMLLLAVRSVEAGQPLVTDDAAVVPPKTCQLEAWAVSTHASDWFTIVGIRLQTAAFLP
jgi:hypothetical protein